MSPRFDKFRVFLSRWLGLITLFLVLIGAAIAGAAYLFGVVGPLGPDHSNELSWFSPSIMFASGRGMVCPAEMDIPAMSDFLRMKTVRFNPADIPDKFTVWDISPFCRSHYYLMTAVGVVWRCFGISWETVKLVPLFLFIAAAGFLYGLFRFGMGRFLSALFTLAVVCSPPMLGMTVSIRDFSKAPFILGAIYLSALLAATPRSRRSLFGVSASLGLLLGIGLGFRQDAMIALPPALAAALFAKTAAPLRWWWRPAAPVLLLAAFFLTGTPILRALNMDEGAVSSHTLFQGLSKETEDSLEFSGASYFLLPKPDDNLVHSVVNTCARRHGDTAPMENYLSPAYGRAGRRMFLEVAREFPADLIDRAYAAAAAVFRVPEELPRQMAHAKGMDNDRMRGIVQAYAPVADFLARRGLLCAVLALALLGAYDLRAALAAACALLYFGGYTSLLFQYRHAFHLAFMPWWAAAFLLAALGRGAVGLLRRLRAKERVFPARAMAMRMLRTGAFLALGTAALALPLIAARVWQDARVHRMADTCAAASLEPMETARDAADGRVLIRPVQRPKGLADSESKPPMEASWDYLAVEVESGGRLLPIRIEYDKTVIGNNFTHTVSVEPPPEGDNGTVKLFFPVYEISAIPPPEGKLTVYAQPIPWRRGRFLGVSVEEKDAACIKALHRVAVTDSMGLLPWLWMPQDSSAVRSHNATPLEGRLGADWANVMARLGDSDTALARYHRLLRWHPAEKRLYSGMDALIQRQPKRWNPVALWEGVANTHADQPRAWSRLAMALNAAGRYADARAVLQPAMDRLGLHAALCDAYMQSMLKGGDLQGAKSYIQWCRDNNCPVSREAECAAEAAFQRAAKASS